MLSNGTFLNVKASLRIAEPAEVKRMYAMPSHRAESNAIGAAYLGHLQLKPEMKIPPLKELYLGPSYDKGEIREILESRPSRPYNWQKETDIRVAIPELLEKGKIVARFHDRMEFGARALGNHSILARADNVLVINELNRRVKRRDFWMPFSHTVLEHSAVDYLASPQLNKVNSEYMIVAFRGA